MSSKPTIVLIPGAMHTAECFEYLIEALNKLSYPTVSKTLPSVNAPDPEVVTLQDVINFIQNDLLLPLFNEGKEVLLVCHSAAGATGSTSVEGFTVQERQNKGEKGGILGIVYITALLVPIGKTVAEVLGIPPWISIDPETREVTMPDPLGTFYNDVEPTIAADLVKKLGKQSQVPHMTPLEYAAWQDPAYEDRCWYIKCTNDQCVLPDIQEKVLAWSNIPESRRPALACGHSPFVSNVDDVVKILEGVITELVGK